MLVTTEAIVLRQTAYTSSSFIVNAYAQEFGLIAFLLRKGGKQKTGVLKEVLSIVEVSFNEKGKTSIITPKKIGLSIPLPGIYMSFHKQSIAVFLAELLSKVIHEQEPNLTLYVFIKNALIELESTPEPVNFHCWFMVQLLVYLGLKPNLGNQSVFLDLESGMGTPYEPPHQFYLDAKQTQSFKACLAAKTFKTFKHIIEGNTSFLKQLITYYKIHIEGLKDLKSLAVLEAVYSGLRN